MTKRILVVDDEESIRFTFREFLSDAGFQVDTAESLIEAATMVGDVDYDAIFLDILLGRDNGLNLLKVMHEQNPNCSVIMVTGSPEIKTAAEAVRHGAFDYLLKPICHEELIRHAQRAVSYKAVLDQNDRYQKRMAAVFEGIRDGIMVFDSTFKLIDINHAATEILSCSKNDVGQTLTGLVEVTGNPVLKALRGLIEERVEGELFQIEIAGTAGEPLILGASLAPLATSTGENNDLVLVIRNETVSARPMMAE